MEIQNVWICLGRRLSQGAVLLRITTTKPNRSYFVNYSPRRGMGGPDWQKLAAAAGPGCMVRFTVYLQREHAAAAKLEKEIPVGAVRRAMAEKRAKAKARRKSKPARARRRKAAVKGKAPVERIPAPQLGPCRPGMFSHIFRPKGPATIAEELGL